MKLNYDFIKKNLEVYNEVREKLSILKDYEEKLVDYNIMSNLNLEKFASFYDQVIKLNNFHGFDNIICDYSFKDLKEIIIETEHDLLDLISNHLNSVGLPFQWFLFGKMTIFINL